MPAYRVIVPCTLTLVATFDADSPNEALDAAFSTTWTATVVCTDDNEALVEDFELHHNVSAFEGGDFAGRRMDADVRLVPAPLDPSWYAPNEPDTLALNYHADDPSLTAYERNPTLR